MQIEKKYWEGHLNADDADAFVQFAEYINMKDFRYGTTSDIGFAKQLESVGSTVQIANPNLPTHSGGFQLINYCIGIAHDWPNRRTIFFTWNNSSLHGIWCYDYSSNTIFKVLMSSDVTGDLNFDKDHLIHSARVENGNVYWTDILNEPRRMNINAGINLYAPGTFPTVTAYTSPLSQSVIAWIRRQPGLPPVQTKITQTSPTVINNLVGQDAYLFAYRYVYKDFELSTLSSYSTLANFNSDLDTFNRIDINIPLGETIDQDVIQIDLVALYMQSGIAFIINSWKKKIAADAAAIAAHNAGTAALTFQFFNDKIGIALDAAYTNKLFDSVPLLCQTIEMAKSRSFMANYLTGYTTPTLTSLALSLVNITYTGTGTPPTGHWYLLTYLVSGSPRSYYLLESAQPITLLPPSPTYYYTWSGTVPPFPASVNASDLTYRGRTPGEAAINIEGNPFGINHVSTTDQGVNSVIITGTSPGNGVQGTVFKTNTKYQAAIHFKDNYGRECGILTNNNLVINTPDTGMSIQQYVQYINWSLSNTNAINEIPQFAYYYSIDLTLNTRTRFFMQAMGVVIYAAKDSSDNYTFTTAAYSPDLAGVAIDLTILNSYGMGYSFTQGDFVDVYVNGSNVTLPIIAQVAQWIVLKLQNVGSLSAITGRFEIYTPYKPSTDEPYYERSQLFPITNPASNTRSYSILNGAFGGDVYVFKRTNSTVVYFTEAMNPNDKYYKLWYTNAGRTNNVDDIGQKWKYTSVAYSNTFISGSENNGLSTFDALDTTDLSPDFGPIQKLQLASKVAKIGTVMLAICSGPSTVSLYLSENTLISQTGDSVVGQANAVIGSVHELKGDYGTLNPESVIEFRGSIYWFDLQNGSIIQYADNGLFQISNYKMSRYWKLFADQYKSMTQAEIEALGNRPFVFGTADPHHGELLFTVPTVLATPPLGFLPDYPSIPYPYDIWDGQGKTIVFKLFADPNRWQGSYSFIPEYSFYMEDNLFSFSGGQLYIHNAKDTFCNYYGTQYSPAVMYLSNQQLNMPKVYNNYSAESNAIPSLVYFLSKYPNAQSSDLQTNDFVTKEGIFYAPIYRNKYDPGFGNNQPLALVKGEKMRTTALYIMAQWSATNGIVQVKFLNIGYTASVGQKV